MKLYDASLLTTAALHCSRVWRRVVPPVGTRWIPYTAAQVTARRAAQMVAVCVCVTVPGGVGEPPRPVPVPPPSGLELVPLVPALPGVTSVPEPGSAGVLVAGLWVLWRMRRAG